MFKRFSLIAALAALLMVATGCQGGTDGPQLPLDHYYEALLAQDYTTAYGFLCKADKAVISQEDFTAWQTLYRQTEEIKSYTLGSSKKLADFKDPFGNRYSQAVEYTVTQTDFVHRSGTENTYDYSRTMVYEDGVWKICRGETADIYQHRLYFGNATLGAMYAEGKGVPQDIGKALGYYASALSYNANDTDLFFQTALLNLKAERPDEAVSLCSQALAKQPEPAVASELQNLMGVALTMLDRKSEAQTAFEQAVKLNPQNSNAVGNLKNITR